MKIYKNGVKRFLDIILSAIGLLMALPFIVITALLIKIENRIPGVFFHQPRPGKNGKVFNVVKMQTMTQERDKEGNLLPNAARLTPMGSFIRSTSLDELPQLWNVLKGDMSLIGPRPLLVDYLELYTPEQARRHEVRPGITGWAQCNGRNSISWAKKFELDVWYVDNISFLTDFKVIAKTVSKVLKREGISAEGQATVQKFNGHN